MEPGPGKKQEIPSKLKCTSRSPDKVTTVQKKMAEKKKKKVTHSIRATVFAALHLPITFGLVNSLKEGYSLL